MNVVLWKEGMFIAKEVFTGVTTQGRTVEEVLENIKETVGLYLEELPEMREELRRVISV